MGTYKRLDQLLANFDGNLKLETASECCWSGELRLTIADSYDGVAQSIVFFKGGHLKPDALIAELMDEADRYLATHEKPLPLGYYEKIANASH
jgi:hypothetical protein